MPKLLKFCALLFIAVLVVGCGGGGGNASGGTGTGIGTSTNTSTSTPAVSLMLVDSDGNKVEGNAIGNGKNYYAQSTVLDATSAAVETALVNFSVSDVKVATLLNSSALTGKTGVAKVQIKPASYSSGTAVLTASTVVGSKTITTSLNLQTTASNVTLAELVPSSSNISAFQNTGVTVKGYVDGALASAGAVSANFTASCGTFSPVAAYSDSSGVVTSTYQPGGSCSGEVTLMATAVGSTASQAAKVSVAATRASSVNFVDATVPLLVSKSVGGQYSRSKLTFQVLDSGGSGMKTKNLIAKLSQSSINGGIKFDDGSTSGGTSNDQTITTDNDGKASVTVIAGDLFTSVQVTASLIEDSSKSAKSYGVAVTSGRATQNRLSISAESLSMESWSIDSVQTSVNVLVSDRLGNPLPKGTAVNFVTLHGLLGGGSTRGTCTLSESSSCSISYTSSNSSSRPDSGRIAILAYLPGEESFDDKNGDNYWSEGETFYPIGRPYIDANVSSSFDSGDQLIGDSDPGTGTCDASGYPSKASTCDTSVWRSDVLVRKQIVIVQATSNAVITKTSWTINALAVYISDANKTVSNNSMPTGSTISAVVKPATLTDIDGNEVAGKCALAGLSLDKTQATTLASDVIVYLNGASDCTVASIAVTVTAPSGTKTTVTF